MPAIAHPGRLLKRALALVQRDRGEEIARRIHPATTA